MMSFYIKIFHRELTWTDWGGQDPNNVNGNEDYVVANDHVDWKWVDQRAGFHKANVICEYEVWQVNGKSKSEI